MIKKFLIYAVVVATLFLGACSTDLPPTPIPTEEILVSPTPVPSPVPAPPSVPTILISEVLTGVDGNNNYDFIEIYNTGSEVPLDLKGWSLWFKLSDNNDESLVYRWTEHSLVPPAGHYLLVRESQDAGIPPDAVFEVSIIPQRGSLQLRRTDGSVADSLSWGSGAVSFAEGNLANGLKNGLALERAPGGSRGNWLDTDDNGSDFAFSSPNPQNTGSPPAPASDEGISLSVEAPASVAPGDPFAYTLSVTNQTDHTLNGITLQLPISQAVEIIRTPAEIDIIDHARFWDMGEIGKSNLVVVWNIGSLDAGVSGSTSITVKAPWTYTDLKTANYSVQTEDLSSLAFGPPVHTTVEGGAIPIGALADLVGEDLVIEGTAAMYTGGFYAGTGNVKFYLEDETGGVQVWVPGGEGYVNVKIGEQIRVAGNLTVYRGALELVVGDVADVEFLPDSEDPMPWTPTPASIGSAANDPALAGKLIRVEGVVVRNEEFSYSYEVDLIDDAGQMITLYVDKQTNINVESIENGHHYRATGILEIYDTRQQLYPRIQEDLDRIFPPVLMLEMEAPNTITPGEDFPVTLTAYNYTSDPLTSVTITATLPASGAQFVAASEGHNIKGSRISWTFPELPGEGSSVSASYQIKATGTEGFLIFKNFTATANEWPDVVGSDPYYVFLGDTVPIWAIQGPGNRSPYTFSPVVTAGIVTGVFPELGGFWIQEASTDDNPLTSAGLFISTGELDIPIAPGNLVQVSGIVRETYQQTQVQISRPEDIISLKTGGPLPVSVMLDPPPDEIESNGYYESLEGMLVQPWDVGIAVGPTSQYGEFVLVLPKHGVGRLWQGDVARNGMAIMVDDGSSSVHKNRSTLPYVVNSGDQVSGLIGPLAYTFGRYKIEPIVQPQVIAADNDLPSLSLTKPSEFSIMTWNVEDLFDVFDPHPPDPEKPSIRDYKIAIAKVANTILAAGAPTIVGLQEVENIDVLEDVAEHEALAGLGYEAILIEGTDSRYIDNGYLVRSDVARVVDVQQHVAPEGLTSRPPLRIEVEIQTESGPARLYVLNNHFTSMSGGEEATEPRRVAQADWNVTILESILAANPEAYLAVIGDLNSFFDSKPIDALRQAGLNHVFEINPEVGWYSYIYQGISQTIDHIMVTGNLYDLIQKVDVLHINADFAPPAAEDESPLRKSDHDPVIATFWLPE